MQYAHQPHKQTLLAESLVNTSNVSVYFIHVALHLIVPEAEQQLIAACNHHICLPISSQHCPER